MCTAGLSIKDLSIKLDFGNCGWSAPRPGRLTPGCKTRYHCTGGWVGPSAGLDRYGKSRM